MNENIKNNGYDNVQTENVAILPDSKKAQFYQSTGKKGGVRYLTNTKNDSFIPMQVKTIDLASYFQKINLTKPISFIKLDVDGSELFVLESASAILKNKPLSILMEWDQESCISSGCDPVDLIDILLENNFKFYFPDYENNSYDEITKEELLEKKSTNTINLLCKK